MASPRVVVGIVGYFVVEHVEREMRRQTVAYVFHTHLAYVLYVSRHDFLSLAAHKQIHGHRYDGKQYGNYNPQKCGDARALYFSLLCLYVIALCQQCGVLLIAHIYVGDTCLYLYVAQRVFHPSVL